MTAHRYELLIGSDWVATGEWRDVLSPWDKRIVGTVAVADASHAQTAIDNAEAALAAGWPQHERAAVLERAAALLVDRHDQLALTICGEAGKPLKAARVEAERAVATLQAAAVAARTLAGEVVPMAGWAVGEGTIGYTVLRPVGVIAAISPFNFPLNLVAHKVAPALAAGCPIIVKPASQTPLSALLLARALRDAGVPDGWLQVVVGPSSAIGDVFVADERVRMMTFTGSSDVGWDLRKRASHKKVTLELGNATPIIVEADADLAAVADTIAASGYGYAGQTCVSIQRVYAHHSIHQQLLGLAKTTVEKLHTGDPFHENTDVGPLIDDDARERLTAWIAEARDGGASIVTGGSLRDDGLLEPTLITGTLPTMQLACKEAFGPVVIVEPYDDLQAAIGFANDTPYGLQASIFTANAARALAAAAQLEFGSVLINEMPSFRADHMPYGGVKQSGNTKEGPLWAVREMTEEQLVVLRLPTLAE